MVVHWFACILGMVAQLMAPPRDEALANAIQAQLDAGNSQCSGCTPSSSAAICQHPCLTDCEIEQLAYLQLPMNAFNQEVDERMNYLRSSQNWVCRFSRAGVVRPPEWHGEIWVAGLYVRALAHRIHCQQAR